MYGMKIVEPFAVNFSMFAEFGTPRVQDMCIHIMNTFSGEISVSLYLYFRSLCCQPLPYQIIRVYDDEIPCVEALPKMQ
jgi:hypothetical protein